MTWPTTRRYARTMQQAFPADGACAVEIYREPALHRLSRVVVCIAGSAFIGWLIYLGL